MSEENISSIKYANPSLMNGEAKCPVSHGSSDQHTNRAQTNKEWWPDQVNPKHTSSARCKNESNVKWI